MRKYETGRLFFIVLSLVLWLLCLWLLAGDDGGREREIFGWSVGFMALMATTHALLFAKYGQRKALEADWLRRNGRPLQAEVVKISRSGHHSEWRIKARCVDARGNVTRYKSHLLNGNPGKKFRIGDPITVYVDPADPKRYWMDSGIEAENL